jgi:hypothetical protein
MAMGLTPPGSGWSALTMVRFSVLCSLSLFFLLATRLEADITKQFPLPGTFNLQQTIKVVGEKEGYKSRARAVIKKQRDGSLTVVTKRKERRRWFTVHKEIFRPSGRYQITYSKPRAVRTGRWEIKNKTLKFSFSGVDGLPIRAQTTVTKGNGYRTTLRYFDRGKLLGTGVVIGNRVR